MSDAIAQCRQLAAEPSGTPRWHAFHAACENAEQTFAERGLSPSHWDNDPVFAGLVIAGFESFGV